MVYRALPEVPDTPNELQVLDLRGSTPVVEAALWQYLFGVDLVDVVTAAHRPVDEPLRWRLADPRQLRTTAVLDRLYMGAFPASLLAAAGRLQELRAGRLAVADRLLTTWPAPLTVVDF